MHGDTTDIDRHVLSAVDRLDPAERDRDAGRSRDIHGLLTSRALQRFRSGQVPTVRGQHRGHSVTSDLIRTQGLRNLVAFRGEHQPPERDNRVGRFT
jgi:hypothetical protein